MLRQQMVYGLQEGRSIRFQAEQQEAYNTELVVLIVMRSGVAEIRCGDQMFQLESNSVWLMQPHAEVRVQNLGKTAVMYDLFLFHCYQLVMDTNEELRYQRSSEVFPSRGVCYHPASTEVRNRAALLVQSDIGWGDDPRVIYLFNELLAKIEEEFNAFNHRTLDYPFRSVLEYVQANAHQALSRDDVARHFGYHPNYFSDRFKKETGWSFSDFLGYVRMDMAKLFLLENSLTIREVAWKVGYQDSLYFSRKFRKQTGMTPSKFREPRRYTRIAAFQFTGTLLAAGMKPAAVLSTYLNVPELLQGDVRAAVQLDPDHWAISEAWRDLAPDLIIAPTFLYSDQKLVEALTAIAPVMMLDWGAYDRLEEVRMIGRILGREPEAEAWIQAYRIKATNAREQLQSVLREGETVGVYELRYDGTVGIWRPSARGAYNLYTMLQLVAPPRIQQEVLEPNKHLFISDDELLPYAADHMFVVVDSAEQARRLTEHHVWQQLAAAKHRRIYPLRLEDFWASEGIALERQLEIQMNCFLNGESI